jgi:hypothetical protein
VQATVEENSIEIPSHAAALHFRRLRSIWLVRDMDRSGHDWPAPHRPATSSQIGLRSFEAITGALAIAGLEMEELKIGSRDYGPSSFSALGPDPSKQELYRQAFRGLKHLTILTEEVYRPGVLALLKSAPLLQELELEFDMPGSDIISIYFLEALTLPNLRVVSFDSMCFPSPRVLLT